MLSRGLGTLRLNPGITCMCACQTPCCSLTSRRAMQETRLAPCSARKAFARSRRRSAEQRAALPSCCASATRAKRPRSGRHGPHAPRPRRRTILRLRHNTVCRTIKTVDPMCVRVCARKTWERLPDPLPIFLTLSDETAGQRAHVSPMCGTAR